MDLDGKQIRRFMTWTPTPGMSQHQIELDLKERAGIAPRTLDRYRSLRTRILKALGHMKLCQIRPQYRSKASFSQTVSLSASTVNRAIRREPITLETA